MQKLRKQNYVCITGSTIKVLPYIPTKKELGSAGRKSYFLSFGPGGSFSSSNSHSLESIEGNPKADLPGGGLREGTLGVGLCCAFFVKGLAGVSDAVASSRSDSDDSDCTERKALEINQ